MRSTQTIFLSLTKDICLAQELYRVPIYALGRDLVIQHFLMWGAMSSRHTC